MPNTYIITLEQAIRQGETPASIDDLAEWHAERSLAHGDRHDLIAFRLYRLANDMRRRMPIAA